MKIIWHEKAKVATVNAKRYQPLLSKEVVTWQYQYYRHTRALWDKESGILGMFCEVIRRSPGIKQEEEISHEFSPVLRVCETREAAIRRVMREIDRWMEEMFAEDIIPRDDDRTDEQVKQEYHLLAEATE